MFCSDSLPVQAGSATGSLESTHEQVAVEHLVRQREPPVSDDVGSEAILSEGSEDDDADGMDYVPEETARTPTRNTQKRARKVRQLAGWAIGDFGFHP